MEIKGVGKLLRIYVGADDRLRGKPLFEAIVLQLREIGLAGATALRGIEGYGAGSRVVHTARLLRLSEDLPILVEVVDSEQRIEQAVAAVEEMLEEAKCGGLMTMEKVEIIRYRPGQ
jgi:PII-like signaling protein